MGTFGRHVPMIPSLSVQCIASCTVPCSASGFSGVSDDSSSVVSPFSAQFLRILALIGGDILYFSVISISSSPMQESSSRASYETKLAALESLALFLCSRNSAFSS